MIRLTLLGKIDLGGPDSGVVEQVLQQPKRLAVLVYLALAGPGAFRSRDTTLALFWPDSSNEKARQSLAQAIHFLRQSLGKDMVANRGPGELGVGGDALWCDVIAFNQALKRGDPEEALRLYAGDLLPGFCVDASPDFERWLDGERNRLRASASVAAWKLALSAEKNTDFRTASVWARRAMDLSCNDEASLQSLLQMLERMDDRAGALKAYEMFKRRLFVELETKPSAETMQLVTRLRSPSESQLIPTPVSSGPIGVVDQGLQKDLGKDMGPARPDPSPGETQSSIPRTVEILPATIHAHTTSRARWLQAVSLVVAVAVLGGLAILGLYDQAYAFHGRDESRGRPHVVIDTLADLGSLAGPKGLGRALTAGLIDRMVQVQSFDVTSGRANSLRGNTENSLLSAPQLLITGSVLQSEGQVRVNVQISDAVTGRTIKTAASDHPSEGVLPLVDTLALQISSLVRTVVGHEVRLRAWSADARSKQVYELMQKADEDVDRARQLSGSGDASASVRALESADATLREAGRIAPAWIEPRISRSEIANRLAVLYLVPPLSNPARAKAYLEMGILEADSAVTIDRSDAAALESLGRLSYWYWLVVPLPADSARRVLARAESNLRSATSAGPGHASALSLLSASLYTRADYAGAYATGNQAYQEDAYLANTLAILNGLFLTSYEIGDDSASAHWCGETNRRFARSWASAYCQLSLMERDNGNDSKDRGVIARAWKIAADVDQSPSAPAHTVGPDLEMLVAAVLARHGLRDSAEAVIRRAHEQDATNSEMLPYEAEARILLKQPDIAAALVTQYFNEEPLRRAGVLRSRRFVSLEALQRKLDSLDPPPGKRR